jgi:spermidine synthase
VDSGEILAAPQPRYLIAVLRLLRVKRPRRGRLFFLYAEVVEWNQGPLGECAGNPLLDPRVKVSVGDVADLLRDGTNTFDAVLLDVDNGPEGITQSNNDWLYATPGLEAAYKALKPEGMLAIWSAGSDSFFTIQLKKAGFKVEVRTVRARAGKGARHTIFMAQKPFRPR